MHFTCSHLLFPSYSFICTEENILDFLSVIIPLKLHEEILPPMSGRHNLILTCPAAILKISTCPGQQGSSECRAMLISKGTSTQYSTLTKKLEHFVPRSVAQKVFLWYKCV